MSEFIVKNLLIYTCLKKIYNISEIFLSQWHKGGWVLENFVTFCDRWVGGPEKFVTSQSPRNFLNVSWMEFVSKKLCFFCDFSLTLWFLKMERAPSGEEKRNQHNEFMRIYRFILIYTCLKKIYNISEIFFVTVT